MNEETVKNEIARLIRNNTCQFRKGSRLITVTSVSEVFITISGINADNPALDNYEFQGSANLSIQDENGTLTVSKQIKGTAKATPISVQITTPISVY